MPANTMCAPTCRHQHLHSHTQLHFVHLHWHADKERGGGVWFCAVQHMSCTT